MRLKDKISQKNTDTIVDRKAYFSAQLSIKMKVFSIDKAVQKPVLNQSLVQMVEQHGLNNKLAEIARNIELLRGPGEIVRYIALLERSYPNQKSKLGAIIAQVVDVLREIVDQFQVGHNDLAEQAQAELKKALLPN